MVTMEASLARLEAAETDLMNQLRIMRVAADTLQPVAMVIDREGLDPALQRTLAETLGGTWGITGVCQEGIGSKGREMWMRMRLQMEETRARWSEWASALVDVHARLRQRTRKIQARADKLMDASPRQPTLKNIRYMRHMVRDSQLNSQLGEELREVAAYAPSPDRIRKLAGFFNSLERQFKAARAVREDEVEAFLAEVEGEIHKVNAAVFAQLTEQASKVPPGSRKQFRQYDQVVQSPLYPGDWSVFYLCKRREGTAGLGATFQVTDVVGAPSKPNLPPVDKTATAMNAGEVLQVIRGVEALMPYFEEVDKAVDDISRQAQFLDKTGHMLMLHAMDAQWSDRQRERVYQWVKQGQRQVELVYRPYQLVGSHLSKTLAGAINYCERSLDNLQE